MKWLQDKRKRLVGSFWEIRCMQEQAKFELLGADSKELSALVEKLGQPAYRWKQLFEALYRQRVTSLEEVST